MSTKYAPGSLAYILFGNGERHLACLSRGFIWWSLNGDHSLAAEGGFDAWPCVVMSTDAYRAEKERTWDAGYDACDSGRFSTENPYMAGGEV